MQAIAFDTDAVCVDRAEVAAAILARLYESVPILKHPRQRAATLPGPLLDTPLSSHHLERCKERDGLLQLGTVGRGNHFVELQRDDEGRLWAMVHTGSRSMGQAIRDHHVAHCRLDPGTGIEWLDAASAEGQAYLADADWARAYAFHNRSLVLERVVEILHATVGARRLEPTRIDADHNHVVRERHGDEELWVHRKGAQAAGDDVLGIVPGSMGTESFHVRGRGNPEALASSSHGAGRTMSRSEARRTISRRQLVQDTEGIWYDHRLRERLREEAPRAYKDIGAVMRAQRELVRIVRRLRPVLVYKGA